MPVQLRDGSSLDLFGRPSRMAFTFPCYPPRGRQSLVTKIGDVEVSRLEVLVQPSPCHIEEPVAKITNQTSWRLAIDKDNGRLYCTTNLPRASKCSIFQLNPDSKSARLESTISFIDEGDGTEYCRRGITCDKDGNIYVTSHHKVEKYFNGRQVKRIIGDIFRELFYDPNGIRYHKKKVYVCDTGNNRVKVLTPELDSNPESMKTLTHKDVNHPEDLDFDDNGNIYIINEGSKAITIFNAEHEYTRSIPLNKIIYPVSMRIVNENFYITDMIGHCLVVFNRNGEEIHRLQIEPSNHTPFPKEYPIGLEVDADGYIYISTGNEILIY